MKKRRLRNADLKDKLNTGGAVAALKYLYYGGRKFQNDELVGHWTGLGGVYRKEATLLEALLHLYTAAARILRWLTRFLTPVIHGPYNPVSLSINEQDL